MRKIRVLIADDHIIVRAGVRSLLEDQAEFEVVGEAGSGWEAIELATRLQPDVVLMDIAMGDLSGLEATQEIKERSPRVNVLALTMYDREEFFFAMLKAGALGYVLKESEPDELLAAIRAVHQGEAFFEILHGFVQLAQLKIGHGNKQMVAWVLCLACLLPQFIGAQQRRDRHWKVTGPILGDSERVPSIRVTWHQVGQYTSIS